MGCGLKIILYLGLIKAKFIQNSNTLNKVFLLLSSDTSKSIFLLYDFFDFSNFDDPNFNNLEKFIFFFIILCGISPVVAI